MVVAVDAVVIVDDVVCVAMAAVGFVTVSCYFWCCAVVIVGADAESVFGDLFEITSDPNELFYSTATVDNIEIINSFTDQNLKKGS